MQLGKSADVKTKYTEYCESASAVALQRMMDNWMMDSVVVEVYR